MKKNTVLIIGSGHRVQKTLLPAVLSMWQTTRLAGVLSRTEKVLAAGKRRGNIRTIMDFDRIDYHTIDVIMVAVTTESVPAVLSALDKYDTRKIILFLDTPVIRLKHLAALKLLHSFKAVYVTEDYFPMTHLLVAQEVIRKGLIGPVHQIQLLHNAYKHHGIAMIKKLASVNSIMWMRSRRISGGMKEIHLRLSGGIRATIREPRDYAKGKLTVTGSAGYIADHAVSAKKGIIITPVTRNGIYIRTDVSGLLQQQYPMRHAESAAYYSTDKSVHNLRKVEGVMRMLEDVHLNRSVNLYPLEDGLYDTITANVFSVFGLFTDLRIPPFKVSFLRMYIHMLIWWSRLNYPRSIQGTRNTSADTHTI